MVKARSQFICIGCGHIEHRWVGRCIQCGEWNSFQEEALVVAPSNKESTSQPKRISEISQSSYERTKTGIKEFDRVVGGGIVRGSLILVGGEPGIGKSTLITEVCGKLSSLFKDEKILYVSGEESEGQLADRSKRLGIDGENIFIFNETVWERIKESLKKIRPRYFILDSIQTTISEQIQSTSGTASQVREVTHNILNYCKPNEITAIIIGHVTKEGNIAGPKILEHMVDTVIYFEGDRLGQYRILRSMKNRFGDTNEVGIFEMKEKGLQEVANPSNYFLDLLSQESYGRSISCIVEGSRTLFIETQALVVENKNGFGRRTGQGVDSNCLAMLVAIVEKYFDIPLAFSDIYINIVGGIKLKTREADLAIIASILSSLKKEAVSEEIVFLGEVGLTGEVRSVPFPEMRIKEIEQLGYKKLMTSKRIAEEFKNQVNVEIVGIEKASELDEWLFQ